MWRISKYYYVEDTLTPVADCEQKILLNLVTPFLEVKSVSQKIEPITYN